MFVRVKKIKGREYLYEVENYRDPRTGKVKQRVIRYLGPNGKANNGAGQSPPGMG